MLILSRKYGQSIFIGDDVVCTVVGIKNYQVSLAIQAPKEVSVYREEIYRRIMAEQEACAEVSQRNRIDEELIDLLTQKFSNK